MHPERPKQPKEPKDPKQPEPKDPRFRFLVGVSIHTLEEELNNIEDAFELRQIIFANGTGFVAVVERVHEEEKSEEAGRRPAHRGKRHDNG